MISTIQGVVKEVIYSDSNITIFKAEESGQLHDCINYNQLTGNIRVNDKVILNNTAVELGLGTGGCHFVVANINSFIVSNIGEGHIMKLRYTPMQINCLAAEAQESPHHEVFNSFESLDGMPIIVGTLHSMLAPAAYALKNLEPKLRIVYIMTDGGALPIWLSDTARYLSGKGIICGTVTCGNAFGGDIECINIYTALIAAKEILKADTAIVCMGPGIAGTDTRYGFSGIEQSYIIDAVNNLGGKAIAIPRISFSDSRSRHYGISHHTRMTLGKLCCTRAYVALPELDEEKASVIKGQLDSSGILSRHELSYWGWDKQEQLFMSEKVLFNKMGKSFIHDKEYFITCGLSAMLVIN